MIPVIYTKRAHLSRWLGLNKNLDTAIHHLMTADLTRLALGRNEIDGDEVFVYRFNYRTMPEDQAIWEDHMRYGDLHAVLSGRERIGFSDVSCLTQTVQKPEEDFVGFLGQVQTWLPMTAEDILIAYPEDAHMVKVADGESMLVDKLCYKFKL